MARAARRHGWGAAAGRASRSRSRMTARRMGRRARGRTAMASLRTKGSCRRCDLAPGARQGCEGCPAQGLLLLLPGRKQQPATAVPQPPTWPRLSPIACGCQPHPSLQGALVDEPGTSLPSSSAQEPAEGERSSDCVLQVGQAGAARAACARCMPACACALTPAPTESVSFCCHLQQYKGHRNYRTVKVGLGGCDLSPAGGWPLVVAAQRRLAATSPPLPPPPLRPRPQGVSLLGQHDEFVMSGSDCGHIFVWDRATGAVQAMLKVGWVQAPRASGAGSQRGTASQSTDGCKGRAAPAGHPPCKPAA